MQRLRDGLYLLESGADVNAYLLEGPRGLTMVDTSYSRSWEALVHELEQGGFSLNAVEQIVLTHGHRDHAGGAAHLVQRHRVRVFAHPEDIPMIQGKPGAPADLRERFVRWLAARRFPYRPLEIVVPLRHGDTLRALPRWQVLHTPGHTPGSLSLYQPTDKVLLCGDALSNAEGVLDLAPSLDTHDAAQAAETARALAEIDVDTLCPGRGPVIRHGASLRLREFVQSLQ